jgi:uncharacterized delta-60 repeat protein
MIKNNQKVGFRFFSLVFQQIWVLVLLILLPSNLIFAAGILDPNFGTGGKVNFRFGANSDSSASSATLQPDGKIVIVGRTGPSGQSEGFYSFAVARLKPDGSLDSSFGSEGLVVTDFNNEADSASSVVIQSDGKIVVGGTRRTLQPNSFNFALVRYNSDGSLDQTFGIGGKVATDFEESPREGISILFLQADGKILALGSLSSPGSQAQIGLVRYNTNGTLDSTFGNSGKVEISLLGDRTTFLDGLAIQPDGKILISGTYVYNRPNCSPTKTNPCTAFQPFLLRYNQQLQLDRKFGRRFGMEFSLDKFAGISLMSNGHILIGGFPLARLYSPNGRLEKVFERPIFPNQNPGLQNGPSGLTERPNGTIVGCHIAGTGGYNDIGIVLFNSNGQVVGLDQHDFFNANDYCSKILVQPDDKFLVVASVQLERQGSYSFAVLRYLDITP